MKLLRFLKYVVGTVAGLAVLAILAIFILSERAVSSAPTPEPSRLARPTAAQIADGPRQLHVLGCVSCHGAKLQGDLFLDDPKIAMLYAPNLTLVAAKATDEQLDHAIRQGIGHDGRPLMVMPSEGYQFMTGQEVAAIIAAIRAIPQTGKATPAVALGPMGRIGLALGKFHPAPELVATFRAKPLPAFGPPFALGRHIVEVNCSECHGPDLKGQEVEPGVVSTDLAIAGAYDVEQFTKLLREGLAPSGKDLGLMRQVALRDFKHLRDDEIAGVHAYLAERARRLP